MSTLDEIETAIERLPTSDVERLAEWLAAHQARRAAERTAELWLSRARGAAVPGVTTDSVMAATRGEA